MHIITQTSRLIIRQFLPEEENTFLDHYNDEELLRYIPKRSREERVIIFRTNVASYAEAKALHIWGIFNKADGDFVGTCLIRPFIFDNTKTELGYSIERKYWNKGIGTEMALAMVEYAFDELDSAQLSAIIIPENTGSQRVLEKAGFKQGETLVRDGVELAYFEIEKIKN